MRQPTSPTSQELRSSTDSWWAWRKCNTGRDETDSVIHQLFKLVDLYQLLSAEMKKMIDNWGRTVLQRSNGVSGGRELKDIQQAHIWNIQFCQSTVVFSKFSLKYPLWQHHYLEDYYMLSWRFGFYGFPIVECDWSAPQRTAHRIDFWQSLMHLLQSSHSSLMLLQINLKAEVDSHSHHMSYKLSWFLQNALFVW